MNSLPQAEYKGAILSIKEKLRRSTYDLAEIEQILEDKYQSMNYVKGWEEEEDNYVLFASPANKKGTKNSSMDDVAIVESLATKQQIAPTRKVARKRVQRVILKKETKKPKKDTKRKGKTTGPENASRSSKTKTTAMMCWESVEDSEQERRKRKMIG